MGRSLWMSVYERFLGTEIDADQQLSVPHLPVTFYPLGQDPLFHTVYTTYTALQTAGSSILARRFAL